MHPRPASHAIAVNYCPRGREEPSFREEQEMGAGRSHRNFNPVHHIDHIFTLPSTSSSLVTFIRTSLVANSQTQIRDEIGEAIRKER